MTLQQLQSTSVLLWVNNLTFNAGKIQLIRFCSYKSVVVDERFEFCGQELTFAPFSLLYLPYTLFAPIFWRVLNNNNNNNRKPVRTDLLLCDRSMANFSSSMHLLKKKRDIKKNKNTKKSNEM